MPIVSPELEVIDMKTAFILACGALLFATGAAAENQQSSSNHPAVAGVVTKIDSGKKQLTLVAPTGAEVEVERMGKSLFVEKGVNLVSIQAPIASSAQVFIDGKQSSFSNLKEGDVVRASFDPNQQAFLNVAAVTPKEIDENLPQAKKDLQAASSAVNQGNKK
jgi:Cu/Ag efflux protein CusF